MIIIKKKIKLGFLESFFFIIIIALIVGVIYITKNNVKHYDEESKEEQSEKTEIPEEEKPTDELDNSKPEPVLSFNVQQGKELSVSESLNLEVYQNINGKQEKVSVTYSSSDTNIATIENNKVVAKKSGSVIITATTKDGYQVKVNLSIKEKSFLTLNILNDYEMYIGDTFTLIASLNSNNRVTQEKVTWSTSNKNIVTVDNGKITAKSKGTATITATNKDNLTTSIKVIVKEKPAKEEVKKDTLSLSVTKPQTLDVDKTLTVKAYRNHNNNTILEKVTWTSSNSSIAKVDSNGLITALKAGKTTITATSTDKLKASIEITVIDKPYLTLNTTSPKTLEMKTSHQLKAYRNYNGKKTEENVIWSSSNQNIVSVSQSGLIYAYEMGTVTITATSSDGLKQTIQVKVPSPPTITINECSSNSLKLLVGKTTQLTYSTNKTINGTVSWSSSKTSVATISSTGKITAKADGMTTITLQVGPYSKTCTLLVYTTYTSTISTTPSADNYNRAKEKLIVTTKDHNNNIISSGLTYKWYLDNVQITSATTNSYTITEYGTYKVEVYKNGSKKTTTTYTPSATKISYTVDKSSDTKFVFVNNPEPISDKDFVDNGKVIYKTSFDKNMEMYFEHNRNTSTPFYYAVRIYNPTEYNVALTLNNSGVSALYSGTKSYDKVWEQYYTGNVNYSYDAKNNKYNLKESYVLTPGQYLYYWVVQDLNMSGKVKFVSTISNYKYEPYNTYLPSSAVPVNQTWSWAFDGVLNLTAKVSNGNYLSSVGGKLEVSNIAVSQSFYKAANKNAINTASTITSKTGGQLTGEYNGKPLVTNNPKFIITDKTPSGTLPTYYSTSSDASKEMLMNGWVTNTSGSSSVTAYQRELIPLTGINSSGASYTLKPFSNIITANYAVHYKENITIVNNSSKSRNVAFYVNSGSGTASQSADKTLIAFVTNSNNAIIRNSYKTNNVTIYPTATFGIFSKRTNIQVWRATIPANTTITVPAITLVGGMSYANLVKMVCLDYCFEGFYQEKVTW